MYRLNSSDSPCISLLAVALLGMFWLVFTSPTIFVSKRRWYGAFYLVRMPTYTGWCIEVYFASSVNGLIWRQISIGFNMCVPEFAIKSTHDHDENIRKKMRKIVNNHTKEVIEFNHAFLRYLPWQCVQSFVTYIYFLQFRPLLARPADLFASHFDILCVSRKIWKVKKNETDEHTKIVGKIYTTCSKCKRVWLLVELNNAQKLKNTSKLGKMHRCSTVHWQRHWCSEYCLVGIPYLIRMLIAHNGTHRHR